MKPAQGLFWARRQRPSGILVTHQPIEPLQHNGNNDFVSSESLACRHKTSGQWSFSWCVSWMHAPVHDCFHSIRSYTENNPCVLNFLPYLRVNIYYTSQVGCMKGSSAVPLSEYQQFLALCNAMTPFYCYTIDIMVAA